MPPQKKKREWVVVRLREPDKNLLRDLAKLNPETKTRHDALLQLTDIAKELELPAVPKGEQPIRLGIPTELKKVLKDRCAETGLPEQAVLVLAARVYRDRVLEESQD